MNRCPTCGYDLPAGWSENCMCESCCDEWEAAEEWREQGYEEARARRVALYNEEMEEWREKRRKEWQERQDAYEILKEERKSAKINEEKAEWDAFLRNLAIMGGS